MDATTRALSTRGGITVREKVIGIESRQPHQVSEVICVKCGKRWISVRPQETLLKELECENCGAGYVVETGQNLED